MTLGNASSSLSLKVVLDPLSSDAQRIIPVITAAAGLDVAITLMLNPATDLAAGHTPFEEFQAR